MNKKNFWHLSGNTKKTSNCFHHLVFSMLSIQIPNKKWHPLIPSYLHHLEKSRWRNFPISLGLSWPLTTNPPNLGGGNRHLRTHYGVPSSKLNIAMKKSTIWRCISYWKGWNFHCHVSFQGCTSSNGWVFPIKNGDFPLPCEFTGGYTYLKHLTTSSPNYRRLKRIKKSQVLLLGFQLAFHLNGTKARDLYVTG